MLQNMKCLSLSGFKELLPGKFQSACAVLLCLLTGSHCQAQVRILDLSEVGPTDFEAIETKTPLLLPPGIDESEIQFSSSAEVLEESGSGENAGDFTEQVAELEQEALSQVVGDDELFNPDNELIETVSYAEMPIVATHQFLGFAHKCSTAVQAPEGNSWIFWRNECRERSPGPIRCSLQSRFVNWRLSSTYLEGCIPEGYSLRHFIEASQIAEFHASTLAGNGPVDQGGSFEDAKKIEGDETRPIQQVSINITPPEGELPMDRAEEKFEQLPEQIQLPGTHRLWCGTSFYWNASLLNHQPLYFEDVNLERHGFSRGGLMQPVVSGMKFFGTLPALPYLMAANPPQETAFTLGQTSPGSHACYACERPRLQLDAATVEAAAVVGLVFLIP